MNLDSPEADNSLVDDSSTPSDEVTGLPGLHTWHRVYWFVVVVFVVYVVLLTGLSRVFA